MSSSSSNVSVVISFSLLRRATLGRLRVGPALLVSTRTAVTGSDEEILQCFDIFKCVVMYSYDPPTYGSDRNALESEASRSKK